MIGEKMNREIKFRAWDKKNKEMVEVDLIDLKFTGILFEVNHDGANHSLNFEDIELMQFTGLHDKNNVEVYEGDIIRHPGTRTTFYVGYYENGARFEPKGVIFDSYLESHWMYYDDYEVIGNIYENPELLKGD